MEGSARNNEVGKCPTNIRLRFYIILIVEFARPKRLKSRGDTISLLVFIKKRKNEKFPNYRKSN